LAVMAKLLLLYKVEVEEDEEVVRLGWLDGGFCKVKCNSVECGTRVWKWQAQTQIRIMKV
jgi:hypothetical protein